MSIDLNSVSIFNGLSEGQLNLLKPLVNNFTSKAGENVFVQGSPATHVYILLKGSVSLWYKPYDGDSIIITHLHSGDVFGWSATIGNPFYTSRAVADADIEALSISGDVLRKLYAEHPDTAKIIIDRLASSVSHRWKNARSHVNLILNDNLKKKTGK